MWGFGRVSEWEREIDVGPFQIAIYLGKSSINIGIVSSLHTNYTIKNDVIALYVGTMP